MKSQATRLILALGVAMLAGCAGSSAQRKKAAAEESGARGVIEQRAELFLQPPAN